VRVAGPFDSPWSVAFLPDGSFLVTERPRKLQLVRLGDWRPAHRRHPGGAAPRARGLLDVGVDPEFATNGIIYLSYLHGDETSSTLPLRSAC